MMAVVLCCDLHFLELMNLNRRFMSDTTTSYPPTFRTAKLQGEVFQMAPRLYVDPMSLHHRVVPASATVRHLLWDTCCAAVFALTHCHAPTRPGRDTCAHLSMAVPRGGTHVWV